jgi:hypothetical protein
MRPIHPATVFLQGFDSCRTAIRARRAMGGLLCGRDSTGAIRT